MSYQFPQQQPFPPIDPSMQGAPGLPATGQPPQGGLPQGAAPLPGQSPLVNPALAQSVIGLQNQQSQQAQVDRNRKMADAMRQDAQGQLQGQQAGRVYKAPGVANLAASLVNSYGSSKLNQDASTQAGAMDKQRQDAYTKYFNALTGQKQPDAGLGDSWE